MKPSMQTSFRAAVLEHLRALQPPARNLLHGASVQPLVTTGSEIPNLMLCWFTAIWRFMLMSDRVAAPGGG